MEGIISDVAGEVVIVLFIVVFIATFVAAVVQLIRERKLIWIVLWGYAVTLAYGFIFDQDEIILIGSAVTALICFIVYLRTS